MQAIQIRRANPADAKVRPVVQAHLNMTSQTSVPEARHALGIDALLSPDIAFYAAYQYDTAVGCGALKTLSPQQMEVKSVHVAAHARGHGIAKQIMQALHSVARQADATQILLETGSDALPAFDAARALYERLGYQYCAPFGDYSAHPESVFMRLDLTRNEPPRS